MRSMFFSAGDYVGYSFSITPIPNSKYFSPVRDRPTYLRAARQRSPWMHHLVPC